MPQDHLLASVRNEFNAVYVQSDIADATLYYGRGAGRLPTASAVVADVVDIVRRGEAPAPPPGGFATKQIEAIGAVEFIIDTVEARPGEVIIVAIGPLTNVAMALRSSPGLAGKIKQLVIMGGAIGALPDGAGNMTPGAEFNFWVDPEAARIVLRSGVPIILSPLNVSRKSRMTGEWYEKLVVADTPFTQMIRELDGPLYAANPERMVHMYDQIAVASLIDPSLVTSTDLYVDVDTDHGISYGASLGWPTLWPGAEGAQKMAVQHELDWERFITICRAEGVSALPIDGADLM